MTRIIRLYSEPIEFQQFENWIYAHSYRDQLKTWFRIIVLQCIRVRKLIINLFFLDLTLINNIY
jgi:hypothetical protein